MREHGEEFVRGLLSDLGRKSTEPIAERAGKPRQGLQRFIGESAWDHQPLTETLCGEVGSEIGMPQGILMLDPTTFLKKGDDSIGVARQWSGRTGQVENCQKGVFLGYASELGRTLVDMRLYLPEGWVKDRERLEKCHAPEGLRHRSVCELGLELIQARAASLPHAWVVGDDEFGWNADFRMELHKLRERYILGVRGRVAVCDAEQARTAAHANQLVWTLAEEWKDGIAEGDWNRITIRNGSKGPVVYEAARRRVRARQARRVAPVDEWLLVLRSAGAEPEYSCHISNAGEEVGLEELARAACTRFWIEDCFERAKGEVGLADYETRSWNGWHHHIALCLLSLWFLVREQRRLGEKTPAITLQQAKYAIAELIRNPDTDAHDLARQLTQRLRRSEQSRIAHWAQRRMLPPKRAEGVEVRQ